MDRSLSPALLVSFAAGILAVILANERLLRCVVTNSAERQRMRHVGDSSRGPLTTSVSGNNNDEASAGPVIHIDQEGGGDGSHHQKEPAARSPNATGGRSPVDDHIRPEEMTYLGPNGKPVNDQQADDSEASTLEKRVRILCWVMTHPRNHRKTAVHVKATWGKRCNILLFMSSGGADSSLPTVAFNLTDGNTALWNKTKFAFKYIYHNYFDQADWFLKADDDTYVVVENLRYMLRDVPPQDPIWFGCNLKMISTQGYMNGGAGYVLSKEALRRFVEIALPDEDLCRKDGHGIAADAEMGVCLHNVNVTAGDSRDESQRWRFFPFGVQKFLGPDRLRSDFWFWEFAKYPLLPGLDCCSSTAVSFHYVSPSDMYVLDYLIYHLRPYGRTWRVRPHSNSLAKYPTTS